MAETPVGVTDQAAGTGVIEVRTRPERGTGLGVEQVVLPFSYRKRSGLYYAVPAQQTVLAAAHGATAGFVWLLNRSAAQMVALRYIEISYNAGSALATPTAPVLQLERMTHTGTPSAGLVTPAKRVRTTQNGETADSTNVGETRTATTGLTPAAGEVVWASSVPSAETGVGMYAFRDIWAPDEDEQPILATGEGLVLRQATAGTASDTRKFMVTLAWEEFTVPT